MAERGRPNFGEYALVAPAALKAYARNPRTHPESQVAQIVNSITAFGFTNPLLIDEHDNIIAGHGRLDAAKRLNLASVPCIRLKGLSEAQKRALVITDNQIALNAGWDLELLSGEIKGLSDVGFDLDLTGFSTDDIDRLLAPRGNAGLTDPDEVPDAPVNPVSQPGDVWLLGRHRLVCGDCTDASVWDRLNINGNPAVFTSPPYGVGENAKLRDKYVRGAAKRKSFYSGYADDPDKWPQVMRAWVDIALARSAVVFCNVQMLANNKRSLLAIMAEYAENFVDIVTWDKDHGAPQMQRCVLANAFEWVFIMSPDTPASRAIPLSNFHGTEQNVFRVDPKGDNKFADTHRATMPVALPRWAIELATDARSWVDPFSGSGTTIIACEMTGRACHAIELNPAYVDVAIKRWQNFTGQVAQRENGEPFQVAA